MYFIHRGRNVAAQESLKGGKTNPSETMKFAAVRLRVAQTNAGEDDQVKGTRLCEFRL